MIPASANPLMMAGSDPLDEYGVIGRSVRFNSPDSAYLSRTPGGAGDLTTWTWSAWVKRSKLTTSQTLFSVGADSSNVCRIAFAQQSTDDMLDVAQTAAGALVARKQSAQVFRDTSAFIHIVVNWDTSNATAADRMRVYVNGTRLSSFNSSLDPSASLASYINSANPHNLGRAEIGSQYSDCLMSKIQFIDGQALAPTSFGLIHPRTGQWRPKSYTGTYGTNGFHLDFSDGSAATAAALGKDRSGNNNDWTPVNISVAAGVGQDWLLDTPTNNFCTLNPLNSSSSNLVVSNGNQVVALNDSAAVTRPIGTTLTFTSKIYFEFMVTVISGSILDAVGFSAPVSFANDGAPPGTYIGVSFNTSGVYKRTAVSGDLAYSPPQAAPVITDVFMVAVDAATGNMWVGRNGSWFEGDPSTNSSPSLTLAIGEMAAFASLFSNTAGGTSEIAFNFGQRAFAYTPPTGFKSLGTKNLAYPLIANPKASFDAKLHTGTGALQSITGVAFQPDLVWVKARNAAESHRLFDSTRGATKEIFSNTTGAEATIAQGLISFDTSGVTYGTSAGTAVNVAAQTYVDWMWKKGATPGFDIVAYTGNGANRTIAHGLGVAPSVIIVKSRTSAENWPVYHKNQDASPATGATFLSLSAAFAADSTIWNNTAPTSTVFSLGTNATSACSNTNTNNYIAYLFAEVPGFSKFGSYVGNGSADGPFVHCGFRPAFVMIKNSSGTGPANWWYIFDSKRSEYNLTGHRVFANTANSEGFAATDALDLVSNGFKTRSSDGDTNASGSNFIFMAFAEYPFRYANAR